MPGGHGHNDLLLGGDQGGDHVGKIVRDEASTRYAPPDLLVGHVGRSENVLIVGLLGTGN